MGDYLKSHICFCLQTDEGAGSDGSLPDSWSSINDDKSIDAMKKFVNNNVSRHSSPVKHLTFYVINNTNALINEHFVLAERAGGIGH